MLGFCITPLKIALCYEQLKKKKASGNLYGNHL